MSKKILCGIAPILVLVVCAVAPSMASAAIKGEYGTLAGEKFTAFPLNTPVKAVSRSTGKFTMESESGLRKLECGTASYEQTLENIEAIQKEVLQVVGISRGQLTFGECIQAFGVGCTEINPKTNHEITGEARAETIKKGNKVKITLGSGFNMKCVIGGAETELGDFDGNFEGNPNGSLLEFVKAKGIKGIPAAGESDNITGNFKTETEAGKEPIVIG